MLAFSAAESLAHSALAPSGTGTHGSGRCGAGGARDRSDQPVGTLSLAGGSATTLLRITNISGDLIPQDQGTTALPRADDLVRKFCSSRADLEARTLER